MSTEAKCVSRFAVAGHEWRTDPLTGVVGWVPVDFIFSEPVNQHGRTVPQGGRLVPPKVPK